MHHGLGTSQGHAKRPSIETSRSNSSSRKEVKSGNENSSDSPAGSTPPSAQKTKSAKAHAVGGRGLHTRVPSHGKGLHKLGRAHSGEGGHAGRQLRKGVSPATSPGTAQILRVESENLLSVAGATTTTMDGKRTLSHTSLRRNKSSAEVRRPKSSSGPIKRNSSHTQVNAKAAKTSVHFDLGTDGPDDGWTEASGSASPNLSRSGSVHLSSGRSSAKPPASPFVSEPHSPEASPTKTHTGARDWTSTTRPEHRAAPDAHQITSRLLKRTPSSNAPPQMSSVSATATPMPHSPTAEESHIPSPITGSTPHNGQKELVSRFVGSTSGTPSDGPHFFGSKANDPNRDQREMDASRKVKSMSNLSRPSQDPARRELDSDDERALAPRSRKSSTGTHNNYVPPQQSRTQQKLWLQRASSNVEQAQLVPSATLSINGFPALVSSQNPLVGLTGVAGGPGYEGRDPRIRLQLDKTGMEYLVVRRYQDPVGRALRRVRLLPGNEKGRGIPLGHGRKKAGLTAAPAPAAASEPRLGLSQSLSDVRERAKGTQHVRERTKDGSVSASGARSSFEESTKAGSVVGSVGSEGEGAGADSVAALLRGLWDKSYELSASTE